MSAEQKALFIPLSYTAELTDKVFCLHQIAIYQQLFLEPGKGADESVWNGCQI